jgi:molybdenum-dependent DNA-binding transcriptional regulator ModE
MNAAAKASGINYRTARRIVEAAKEYRQRSLRWSAHSSEPTISQ